MMPVGIFSPVSELLVNRAGLHHKPHPADSGNVFGRVAVDRYQVSQQAGLDLAYLVLHVQDPSIHRGGRSERINSGHTVFHHRLELASIIAMREYTYIAPARNCHSGVKSCFEAIPLSLGSGG